MLKKLCKSMSKSSVVFMLILTFSLIFASISYGWMATNRKVRGNGLEIISKTPDPCEVVSFQVLKKSAIDGSASCVCDSRWSTFNRSTAYFEMDAYDSIFDDNNDTTPVIIRVVIKNKLFEKENLPRDIKVTAACEENHLTKATTSGQVMAEYISNIVMFDFVTDGTLDKYDTETNATAIYDGVMADLEADDSPYVSQSFVTVKNDSYSKEDSFSKTISNYDVYEEEYVYIYIAIRYCKENVEAYINDIDLNIQEAQEGSSTGIGDTITFDFDLKNVVFMYEGKK